MIVNYLTLDCADQEYDSAGNSPKTLSCQNTHYIFMVILFINICMTLCDVVLLTQISVIMDDHQLAVEVLRPLQC